MSNIAITNNTTDGVFYWDPEFVDDTLTAGGAVTWVAGTVLARNSVSNKLTAYTVGGSNGENIPKAVLTYAVTFGGAGDLPARVMTFGNVRRENLVAHGVGAATQVVVDGLRDYGIRAVTFDQLTELDNQ